MVRFRRPGRGGGHSAIGYQGWYPRLISFRPPAGTPQAHFASGLFLIEPSSHLPPPSPRRSGSRLRHRRRRGRSGRVGWRNATEGLSQPRRSRREEAQTPWNSETPHVVSYSFERGSTFASVDVEVERCLLLHHQRQAL